MNVNAPVCAENSKRVDVGSEVTALRQQLTQLSEDFQRFAHAVSHDLNAPVRAMVGFSGLLLKKYGDTLDDKGQQYLSFIVGGGEKLQAMMAGLLQYSRLNTGTVTPVAIETNMLVEECLGALHDQIHASGAIVTVDTLPNMVGDANQIHQLFMCLLENALRFHKLDVPPQIKVLAGTPQDSWIFCVIDQGIGIDARFHEDIFLVFRKLHGDSEYPGVGMGLTLAKKIVENHHGRIWVESSPNEGARFFVWLPPAGTEEDN
jgi:light-regulated signal transduction histidine kinase (bacteriophytochrome)